MPEIGYSASLLTGPNSAIEQARLRVRGVNGLTAQMRDLIEEAGNEAEAEMLARVPRSAGSAGKEKTIAGSIRSTRAEFRPGGSGGGGVYEVQVGPGPDAPGHLRYVLEGTGLKVGHGAIRSKSGKAMPIGDGIFRQSQSGQKPNTEWIEAGRRTAKAYIRAGITRLNT